MEIKEIQKTKGQLIKEPTKQTVTQLEDLRQLQEVLIQNRNEELAEYDKMITVNKEYNEKYGK